MAMSSLPNFPTNGFESIEHRRKSAPVSIQSEGVISKKNVSGSMWSGAPHVPLNYSFESTRKFSFLAKESPSI